MLIIFCAELEEAKNIKCADAKIYITGVGVSNILKAPVFILKPNDKVVNVGYAGSNKYEVGSVVSVNRCSRLFPLKITKEKSINLFSCYKEGDICYTADNFIESASTEVPLVDMELFYLASIYPQMQSLKIVSDNLDYKIYKETDFEKSWEIVNNILNNLVE